MNAREFGRRLKAALALRGWNVTDLARAIPPEYRLSKETIYRTAQGKRTPNDWEIPLLAERLDVPVSFLRHGFTDNGQPEPADDLQATLDEILREVRAIEPVIAAYFTQTAPKIAQQAVQAALDQAKTDAEAAAKTAAQEEARRGVARKLVEGSRRPPRAT